MDSPPSDLQNINPNRRTTRSALAEIPARLGRMSVDDNSPYPPITALVSTAQYGQFNASINIPLSYLSPSPSPDELIIQQRGRRRIPVTWSPDIDSKKDRGNSEDHTPQKCSPSKTTIVLRSTPRKRLLLNDPKELFTTPEKLKKMSPNSKRGRIEKPVSIYSGPLHVALKGLSQQQLMDVILHLVDKRPELEEELKEILPSPDLRPLEEKLNELKKNIFKSLPSSRLTSKTDSPAYNRAHTHVLSFKKCVQDQGRQLSDSQYWGSLLDYVFLAWTYVRGTPVWDHPPHNNARKQCFKFLASQCLTALKKGVFTTEQCDDIEEKLERCSIDSEEIQSCIKQLTVIRKKH
uniref:Tethering factor for nuclear proteasome STS1 n=1 Tax=Timema shepardi TaxID=629360 RepID=A0A7R9ANP6_TIMSH|nr:unnamed protein product [Timema shepardi]